LETSGENIQSEVSPVLFFNASTRIHTLSINASISLLASWTLQSEGIPVYYAVCQSGLMQCILGTNQNNFRQEPPCKHCTKFSELLFPEDRVIPIHLNIELAREIWDELEGATLHQLSTWMHNDFPIGELCLPGIRWVLRRHHLDDDDRTKYLLKQYLASAASLVGRFEKILDEIAPQALVVFNGLTYPEAVVRHLARTRGVEVITHEVGLGSYSAFFSRKDATFRELEISPEFELSQEEYAKLDDYLERRFEGQYSMAGIRFWPEMSAIPDNLRNRIRSFAQMVSVFTNVIFDTSQLHANLLFEEMFDWLEELRKVTSEHPETLFIIRAHPDENRPGKESNQSVANWVEASGVGELENVEFIGPSVTVSSYELIRLSKIVLVYNSSIGLEAAILGAAVLCAGRARYTQIPTVFFPENRIEYLRKLNELLDEEFIEVPKSFGTNAKRFLFYELFRASLDLSEFLRPYPRAKGMTLFHDFDSELISTSESLKAIREGILENGNFTI
jgi:hypothetical protein